MKRVLYALAVLAVFVPYAAGQAAPAQTPAEQGLTCKGLKAYPSVVVLADSPTMFYYCKNDQSSPETSADINANPADIPIPLKNTSSLTVIVKGVNPVRDTFTVAFDDTPFTEIDGSVLAKLVGGSLPSSATTVQPAGKNPAVQNLKYNSVHTENLGSGAPGQPAQQTCDQQYDDGVHQKVSGLQRAAEVVATDVANYNSDVTAAQNAYNNTLGALKGLDTPSQSELQSSISRLIVGDSLHPPVSSLTDLPKLVSDGTASTLTPLVGESLDDVISKLSAQAVKLHGSLQSSITATACPAAQDEISGDQAFLESLFDSTGSKTSLADELKTQLTTAKTLAATVVSEESTLQGIVNDPSNFEIDARIPPEYRIQTSVKVTVSWADKLASAQDQNQGAGAQPAAAPAAKPAKGAAAKPANTPPTTPAKTPTTTPPTGGSTNSLIFTVNFGQGPRIFESAGIVFSPLAQHSFASAPVTTNQGGFCTLATGTAAGCIVDNGGTGWRVLPAAIASVRWVDVNSKHFDMRQLAPNYLSFGATVKSNSSSGTSLEYLAGPSWSLAGQSLFLTAGGYAGQVTELAGGLKLGPQTTAPPTTLPTSTSYKWGFGFSITYKIASQGATAGKVSNPSKPTTTGSTTQ